MEETTRTHNSRDLRLGHSKDMAIQDSPMDRRLPRDIPWECKAGRKVQWAASHMHSR